MDNAAQVELFAPQGRRDAQTLWTRLNTGSRRPVAVTLTRNRVTMCSVTAGPDGRIRLRLHEAFLEAPEPVISALHGYIRTGQRRFWEPVADFARTIIPAAGHVGETGHRMPPRANRVHDLQAIAHDVNRQYFNDRIQYRIEWGRERPNRPRRRRRSRSIRFGTWISGSHTVRVHPLLDDARVPEAFIAYIVYHELLHAVVPPRIMNGRSYDHSSEFRRLEREFAGFEAMRQLSRRLLDLLLP